MKPLLLLHAPRTAGRSLAAALGVENREPHRPAWSRDDLEDHFVVAFVRDPYTRAESLFRFVYRTRPDLLTSEEFVRWLHTDMRNPRGEEQTLYKGTPYSIHVCAPQVEFIGTRHDFRGHFEQLKPDWARLMYDRGFRGSFLDLPRFPHLNQSPGGDSLLSEDARARIGEIYAADFDAFWYPRDEARGA